MKQHVASKGCSRKIAGHVAGDESLVRKIGFVAD
jgi:hypothetical protein